MQERGKLADTGPISGEEQPHHRACRSNTPEEDTAIRSSIIRRAIRDMNTFVAALVAAAK